MSGQDDVRECTHPVTTGRACHICASTRAAIARAGDPIERHLGRTGRDELLARIALLESQERIHQVRVAELEAEKARLSKEHAIMLETLTTAQAKGSALQDEARALRRVLQTRLENRLGIYMADETPPLSSTHQFAILVDLLKVRFHGDCKYGNAEAHADLPLHTMPSGIRSIHEALLEHLRNEKAKRGRAESWEAVIAEENAELAIETGAPEPDLDRVEAEALDVANIHLKLVETIRIRRARAKEAT